MLKKLKQIRKEYLCRSNHKQYHKVIQKYFNWESKKECMKCGFIIDPMNE